MIRRIAIAAGSLLVLTGCGEASPTPETSPTTTATAPATASKPSPTPSGTQAAPPLTPEQLRVGTATDAVRHLAGEIGPRPGTSPAYHRAAAWVEGQLAGFGWQVHRQRFQTPAGVSWGIPVRAGESVNLVADRGDVRPGQPWLLVGAHLDTVPQAPGAEDNASGVAVLLAIAEAAAGRSTRVPVRLVVFGSEEPRGETDGDHHYGSRAYVASLTPVERRSLAGMVSLDRVGVGKAVPACGARPGLDRTLASLRAAARRAKVPTTGCSQTPNRSSDHWSFVRAGLPGVRLGSTPYAAYHSPADTPDVVDPAQLVRTGRIMLAWLA